MKAELTASSDEVWQRTRARIDGLTDDEYFWEPAPGCWTIRQRADGSWTADMTLPGPRPEPFTTIAWRLWHLIDMYGEDRGPRYLGVAPQGPPIGPVGGPYAARSRAAFVHHMLDEFVHHSAEVALFRDLWRWQHPVVDDPLVERVIRGDDDVLDALADRALTAELVDRAAAYGRWDLVVGLVERGAPIDTGARSPLHLAAGAGELAVVQALLAHGADPSATDPEYHATPREWAEYLRKTAVAASLAEHT